MNVLQTISGLEFDVVIPQRDLLLDEAEMAHRFSVLLERHGCSPVDYCKRLRTKYRVGVSLRVLHEVCLEGNSYNIAGRTFPAEWDATTFAPANRAIAPCCPIPPVFRDAELNTGFWTFPNDRKISNLAVLTDVPQDLANINGKRWINSRVVAHAPEKSVTAQCLGDNDEVLAYAKVYAGDEGSRVFATYNNVNASLTPTENSPRLPRALSYCERRRILLLEQVAGHSLAHLEGERQSNGFHGLGAALANLHRVDPPSFLTHFKRLTPESVQRAAWTISQARPDVAWCVSQLAHQLIATYETAEELPVLLHGDVHPKNCILGTEGWTLIDLDQATIGPRAADLGSLIAGLHYDQCVGLLPASQRASLAESVLTGYEQAGQLPTAKSLRWHTAAALLEERALRAINRVRIEGLKNLAAVLSLAATVLGGGGHD